MTRFFFKIFLRLPTSIFHFHGKIRRKSKGAIKKSSMAVFSWVSKSVLSVAKFQTTFTERTLSHFVFKKLPNLLLLENNLIYFLLYVFSPFIFRRQWNRRGFRPQSNRWGRWRHFCRIPRWRGHPHGIPHDSRGGGEAVKDPQHNRRLHLSTMQDKVQWCFSTSST